MSHPSELPSQSASSYSGLTDFSTKRQRTSIDLSDRSFYDPNQYTHRTYVDQRPQLHTYTPRDQQITAYSSGFAQPQTAISSVSEFSLGHQRTSSSNASSPYNNISPHTEVAGHPWTGSSNFYQQSIRDPLSHYQQAQYSDVQQSRSAQFTDLYQRPREQHPTARMQLGQSAYSFSRVPESESLIGASYNQTPRTMTMAPSYTNASSRLPSTDQMGDSFGLNRQQYTNSAMPTLQQVLPPLESTVSSGHSRGSTQQQLSNNILPSIEPQSILSSNSQAGQDNTQETYDPSAFTFSYPNPRGPDCDDG